MKVMRFVFCAAIVCFAFACGNSLKLENRPLFSNGVNVYQVLLVDGQSGAAISSAAVQVIVGRQVLTGIADVEGGNRYSVYGIPPGNFLVSISASGYGDFQDLVTFSGSGELPTSDYDYVFNNIALFPAGSVSSPITVRVYDSADGAAIANASVVAVRGNSDSILDDELSTESESSDSGLILDVVEATTDSSGEALLPAAGLLLGATYAINVFNAQNASGQSLVKTDGTDIQVGIDFQVVELFLGLPPETPVARSSNNETFPEGLSNLQISFPYAMEVCSDANNHNWVNNSGDTDGDGSVATPAAVPNAVSVALSNNDMTLTLTHIEGESDNTADNMLDSLNITFQNVSVQAVGAGTCTSLTKVSLRGEGTLGAAGLTITVR